MLNRQRPPAITIQPPNIDDLRHSYFGYSPQSETDAVYLNLGAETPQSAFSVTEDGRSSAIDSWARSGFAVYTSPTTRTGNVPLWRSSRRSTTTPKKDLVDRDCGICFEISVVPCRTSCCGTIFCLEHISDWLHDSSSDGRCPACQAPCTLESATILASAAPTPTRSRPPASASASYTYPTPPSRFRKTPPFPLRPKAPSTTSSSAPSTPVSTPPTSAAELYSDDEGKPKLQTQSRSRSRFGSARLLYCRNPGPGPGPSGAAARADVTGQADVHLQKAEMDKMSPWVAQDQDGGGGSLRWVTSVVGLALFLYAREAVVHGA